VVFPGDPILWWSPDPRAVLWPAQFHLSRSMKRFHAKSPYRVTLNHAFGQVIEGCAEDRHEGTWITRDIIDAYHRLHELGYAHSIEVWEAETGWRHVWRGAGDAVLWRVDVLPRG
jgi:leucyl/phenylalanyl-tRNA--protein transferase